MEINKKLIRNSTATLEYIYIQVGEKFIKIDFLKKSRKMRTSIKVPLCFSAFLNFQHLLSNFISLTINTRRKPF